MLRGFHGFEILMFQTQHWPVLCTESHCIMPIMTHKPFWYFLFIAYLFLPQSSRSGVSEWSYRQLMLGDLLLSIQWSVHLFHWFTGIAWGMCSFWESWMALTVLVILYNTKIRKFSTGGAEKNPYHSLNL